MSDRSSRGRGLMTAGLIVAIGVCAWFLPWGNSGVPFEEVAASQLDERIAQYQKLRTEDDWVALYEMTSPRHRRLVDRNTFLQFYGGGVLRMHELKTKSVDLDTKARRARVAMAGVGQLIAERLPASYRKSVKTAGPAGLRHEGDFEISWVWDEGDWFFEMDGPALGAAPKGRSTAPLDPAPK